MTTPSSIQSRGSEPRTSVRAAPSDPPVPSSLRGSLPPCPVASLPSSLAFARRQFGISDWRPLQAEAIAAAFAGRDSLVVMGTGSGKSLCYQVPALMNSGLTVVVSPLIALMKDQVDRLQSLAFPVAALNSTVHHRAESDILRAATTGRLRMLYVSPERCVRPDFLDAMTRAKDHLAAFVIDEAHCISQWGHDFRKAYASLGQLRVLFPKVPIHAFTATATPRVREQIMQSLGFHAVEPRDEQSRPGEPRASARAAPSDFPSSLRGSLPPCPVASLPSSLPPIILIGEFDRPNLFLRVHCGKRTDRDLVDEVRELQAKHGHGLSHTPSGIIYCITRAETERVANLLREEGFSADAYHAGLDDAQRSAVHDAFLVAPSLRASLPPCPDASLPSSLRASSPPCPVASLPRCLDVVVATIAFGMGIDKADVRFLIHWGMPSSPDVYHQEIGRAGRDGKPADCVMFHGDQDYVAWRDIFEMQEQGGGPPITDGKMDALADMESYCGCSQLDVDRPACRHAWLRHYFNAPLHLPRGDTEGSSEPRTSVRAAPSVPSSLRDSVASSPGYTAPCSVCDNCMSVP